MGIARILLLNWNQKFVDVQLNFKVIFLLIELYHKHLTFGWVSIRKSCGYSSITITLSMVHGCDCIGFMISFLLVELYVFWYILESECNGYSNSCIYNDTLKHDVCTNCIHLTTGYFCHWCIDDYYINMWGPLMHNLVGLDNSTYSLILWLILTLSKCLLNLW